LIGLFYSFVHLLVIILDDVGCGVRTLEHMINLIVGVVLGEMLDVSFDFVGSVVTFGLMFEEF
jgi:hypothetical protein